MSGVVLPQDEAAAPPAAGWRVLLAADLAAATGRRGWRAALSAWCFEPGFACVAALRTAQALRASGWPRLAKWLWRRAVAGAGCHLHLDAHYGPGLHLPHPAAIVVGAGACIGAGVTLYQGVTLGLRDAAPAYPHLADGCTVFAHALVLGGVRIGRGARVAAAALVLHDVPDGCVAIGQPARMRPLRRPA